MWKCSFDVIGSLMMTARCALVCLALPLGLFVAAKPSLADVTYRYISGPFASISDSAIPAGSYDASTRLEFSITLLQPLPPNASGLNLTGDVVAFAFTDGRATATSGDLDIEGVHTDSEGSIIEWTVELNFPPTAISTVGQALWVNSTGGTSGPAFNAVSLQECTALPCDSNSGSDIAQGSDPVGGWLPRVATEPYYVYTYTSPAYDTFIDSAVPAGSYDASTRLECSLTFAQHLPPNTTIDLNGTDLLAISITDGRVTEADGDFTFASNVETDSEGAITNWIVEFNFPPPSLPAVGQLLSATSVPGVDAVFLSECAALPCDSNTSQDIAQVIGSAGDWEQSTIAPTPVPAFGPVGRVVLVVLLMSAATTRRVCSPPTKPGQNGGRL